MEIDKDSTEVAKAAKAAAKKNPDQVALVDKYIAQYPAAQSIRGQLIAKAMASGEIAAAVRKFMDEKVGA